MSNTEIELEAWIEEHVAAYLDESRASARPDPEVFAGALAQPVGGEHGRRQLLARLRLVADIASELGAGRDSPIEPGRELDDFVIEESLGRGGMGQVWRARQKSIDRSVAIKSPHWLEGLDARGKARFWREAQAVARLRHPSIVPLYQIGEHRGAPYFVMELVRGETLAQAIRALQRRERARDAQSLGRSESSFERAAASVVLAAAEGVEAAHQDEVVHRDLKPSNLMIGEGGAVRILDFGLARWHGADALTQSGELLGTLEYLAPELVHSLRAATPASDVYALGVVLYELLALERPFSAPSTPALLARITTSDAVPLHVRRRAPRALSAIVEKAMAHDVTRRYASAALLAEDLRAFLAGGEVSARPSGPLARLGRRMQRRPALTSVAVLALIASAVAFTQWQRLSEANAASRQQTARLRLRTALLDEQRDSSVTGAGAKSAAGKERAVHALKEALDLDPANDEARCHLTALLINLGRESEAIPHLEQLERTFAAHEVVRWLRYQVDHDSWARLVPAADFVDRWRTTSDTDRFYAVRAWHKVQETKSIAVDIALTLHEHPEYGATAMVFEAIAITVQLRPGESVDHVNAARLYQAALTLVPEHPVVVANLSYALIGLVQGGIGGSPNPARSGRDALPLALRDGLRLCEAAIVSAPDYDFLWTNYAWMLARAGETQLAVERLRPKVREFPDNAALQQNWLSSVATEIQAGRPVQSEILDEALEAASESARREPKNPLWHVLAAWIWRGLDDPDGVDESLQQLDAPERLAPELVQQVEALRAWVVTRRAR
ncbi:MAG: protein kinase domain-containing protein [Planctomycetota bacterium]